LQCAVTYVVYGVIVGLADGWKYTLIAAWLKRQHVSQTIYTVSLASCNLGCTIDTNIVLWLYPVIAEIELILSASL
jgi:hypothetical protein